MHDSELYKLVSIRRRNGGMFLREQLYGRQILTKDLQRIIPGTFTIARRQIIHGASALATDEFADAVVSSSYSLFVGRDGCVTNFFAWLAKHPLMYAYFLDASHGIVIEKMNFDVDRWLSYPINLPTVHEQCRIVEILNSADDAIRATERIIAKLEKTRQGLLHDLLTPAIVGRVKATPLGDVSVITGGVTLGKSISHFGSIELPYLRVANVQDGFIDTSEMKKVRILRTELERYQLRAGDVLMTEGGDFDKLGRGAVWDGSIDPCLHQNHIFRVRCDRSILLPQFLAMYSGSPAGRRHFVLISKQTTNLASINMTQLKAFPVPIPPLEEQSRIVMAAGAQNDEISVQLAALRKLRLLKRGLMDDLLMGRVRVGASK
jgi:restriction endonuclease S subunit